MYFDLQKAFDTVDHKILLSRLFNYGVRVVYNWFANYLTDMSCCDEFGGQPEIV